MPEVSDRTLVVAIQAVDAEMRRLAGQIDASEDDSHQADLEELLLTYSHAAEDLKKAYYSALRPGGNLPPYSKLVAQNADGDE